MSERKKILIVSDTHGNTYNLYEAIKKEAPFDTLLHAGDVCQDVEDIEAMAGAPYVACACVRGNCDMFSGLPESRDMVLGGVHVHMEHGYWPPVREDSTLEKAKRIGAQVMIYGHTHKPEIRQKDGIWIINPGSLTRPRQADGRYTYIVMTIGSEGTPSFELRSV